VKRHLVLLAGAYSFFLKQENQYFSYILFAAKPGLSVALYGLKDADTSSPSELKFSRLQIMRCRLTFFFIILFENQGNNIDPADGLSVSRLSSSERGDCP
jgi:hypothetical protein